MLDLQVALPFLHEHELPEAVRFEMQQAEEAQRASGALHSLTVPQCQSVLGMLIPGSPSVGWITFGERLCQWSAYLPTVYAAAAPACPEHPHTPLTRQQLHRSKVCLQVLASPQHPKQEARPSLPMQLRLPERLLLREQPLRPVCL